MNYAEIYRKLEKLSQIADPTDVELFERVNLTVMVYNINRNESTDEDISKTRTFLSSDLYSMISVCYQPALDDLINAEIQLNKAEADSFEEELIQASETHSKSQSINIARKLQKSNETYLKALKEYQTAKKFVNIYDKTMKMGSQVLNSMARRAKES